MDGYPDIDDFKFPAPGGIGTDNAQDKLIEQLVAVATLNGAIRAETSASRSNWTDNLPDRLKRCLDDLLDNLQMIVKCLPEVATYAVSVGLPAGIGVTVTFHNDLAPEARSPRH